MSPTSKEDNFSAKSFVFTINNFTEKNVENLKAIPCQRIICGKEVGAKGTPHIQGAITFKQCVRREAFKQTIEWDGFCGKMKGEWADQQYCFKDGDIIRMEDNSQQGSRTDIEQFREAIKRGATDAELCDNHAREVCKYQKFIDFCRQAYGTQNLVKLPRGTKKNMGLWIWGPGSTGKTTWVEDNFEGFYEKQCNKWWDGYAGEPVVVIDDPLASWSKHLMGYIKAWVNERIVPVEVKGGSRKLRFENLIITANKSPEEFFGEDFEDSPFYGRFTVFHCAVKGNMSMCALPSATPWGDAEVKVKN